MPNIPAIKARYEAATGGPWTAELDYISAFIPGKRPNGEIIGRWHPSISDLLSNEQKQANAEFAAHARTDIPQLVTALEEAQELLREVVNAKPARLKAAMFAAENYIRIALGESK